MSMESKIEHLKKEVRMLRDTSIELYVDLDNAKWRASHVQPVRHQAIPIELGADLLPTK